MAFIKLSGSCAGADGVTLLRFGRGIFETTVYQKMLSVLGVMSLQWIRIVWLCQTSVGGDEECRVTQSNAYLLCGRCFLDCGN